MEDTTPDGSVFDPDILREKFAEGREMAASNRRAQDLATALLQVDRVIATEGVPIEPSLDLIAVASTLKRLLIEEITGIRP